MKRAFIVIGMSFGDEGKGAACDALCRRFGVDLVVRFNGGCQCGHAVQLADGRRHTFSQFGSGTLAGVPTYLGPNVIVDPEAILREADHLRELDVDAPLGTLTVDPACLVTTRFHRLLNRIRETRRAHRHGSCGQGIGEARSYWLRHGGDALAMRDLADPVEARYKLELLKQRLLPRVYEAACGGADAVQALADEFVALPAATVARRLASAARRVETGDWASLDAWQCVVMEGAQGVLLDQDHGMPPHHTWSVTTDRHARELLATVPGEVSVRTIGCVRAFTTRHGAGPLPSHDEGLTRALVDPSNPANDWQGGLRVGHFDFALHRYAAAVQPVDGLAVSWLDHFPEEGGSVANLTGDYLEGYVLKASDYPAAQLRLRNAHLLQRLPMRRSPASRGQLLAALGAPVVMKAFGPTAEDRVFDLE